MGYVLLLLLGFDVLLRCDIIGKEKSVEEDL